MQQYRSNLDRLQEVNSGPKVRLMAEASGRRNHGCAIVNNRHFNILGRWAESTEEMDANMNLNSSIRIRPCASSKRDDPHNHLCDLNHVVAVPLQRPTSNKTEIWIACGFSGHRVGSERSTRFARIIDTDTLQVHRGPDLDVAGGACAALALPMHKKRSHAICAFGGTDGGHDDGIFLNSVRCYDTESASWFAPFSDLPFGLDHANAVLIEAGTCSPKDPPRVLLLNFRFQHFANMRTEIFVAELPPEGLSVASTRKRQKKKHSLQWSLFSNSTRSLPRDASGAITIYRGRYVVQYGGVFYAYDESKKAALRARLRGEDLMSTVGGLTSPPIFSRNRGWHIRMNFAEIRALDVCDSRDWFHVGRLRSSRFATQTCRSDEYVFTCGGRKGGGEGGHHAAGHDRQNLRDCEIQRVRHLEVMVQNAAARAIRRRERRPYRTEDSNVAALLQQRFSEEGRRRALSAGTIPKDKNNSHRRIQQLSSAILEHHHSPRFSA